MNFNIDKRRINVDCGAFLLNKEGKIYCVRGFQHDFGFLNYLSPK